MQYARSGSGWVWGLAGVGAALRLWQFLGGASLWLDELALAKNILGRPLPQLLFHPLDSWQVAPQGFLLVERVAAVLSDALGFPGSAAALRLFPLLASFAALFLFVRLAERTLDGFARPFAVACFALAPEQIFYGSEVKPYAIDVAVALLLWLLALRFREAPRDLRRAVAAGAVGALAVGFSQPAVLMAGGLGVALLALALARREPLAPVSALLALWWGAAAAVTLASFASLGPATRDYLHHYWAGAFPPSLSRPLAVLAWLGDAAQAELTHDGLSYKGAFLYIGAAAVGLALLWRRRRDLALLLTGPCAVTLLAAVLHQYPWKGRLIAFLIPAVLLPMAAGIEALRQALPSRPPALRVLVLAALCLPPVQTLLADPPVYRLEAIEVPTHKRTVADNVYAYLYDLSDPARLAAATAETFPLDAAEGAPDENAGCQGPQRPGPVPTPAEQLAAHGRSPIRAATGAGG